MVIKRGGRGFAHLCRVIGALVSAPSSLLLTETSFAFLLENGTDRILLET